jgi:hypothetical protein
LVKQISAFLVRENTNACCQMNPLHILTYYLYKMHLKLFFHPHVKVSLSLKDRI